MIYINSSILNFLNDDQTIYLDYLQHMQNDHEQTTIMPEIIQAESMPT